MTNCYGWLRKHESAGNNPALRAVRIVVTGEHSLDARRGLNEGRDFHDLGDPQRFEQALLAHLDAEDFFRGEPGVR
jgi:hypothetical protein